MTKLMPTSVACSITFLVVQVELKSANKALQKRVPVFRSQLSLLLSHFRRPKLLQQLRICGYKCLNFIPIVSLFTDAIVNILLVQNDLPSMITR